MNSQLLSFLGIARRANALTLGFDPTVEAMSEGKVCLLLLTEDLSSRTLRNITAAAQKNRVQTIVLENTSMDQIGAAIGKRTGIVAVNDEGFSNKLKTLCGNSRQEECL
ncbi:MAG: L7Ae/L30e/S12e/Gadd45 family ribosomal protein [Acutalibacteraceae bacterium]